MTITRYSGPPIVKRDPDKGSDKTSPQLLSVPIADSRIHRSSAVTYARIREIRRDPTICLAKQAVLAPIIHTPWMYKEREGAPSGAVDFIKNNLCRHRDYFLESAVYGALDYGWQPFEVVYEPKDGEIYLKYFKSLYQDFTTILVYVDTGDFAGYISRPLVMGIEFNRYEVVLDTEYCQHIAFDVEGTDWYGNSVYECLDDIQCAWVEVQKAAERYDKKVAGAMWVVYYPVGQTPYINGEEWENHDIAEDILKRIISSGGVAIPDEIQEWMDEDSIDKQTKGKWRVELISASGTSTANTFVDRQKYLDNLKVRAFGIPERSLLEGKFGTKAEAETHADIALATINTKHRMICHMMNEQVVNNLIRYNYGEGYENTVYVEPAPLVDAQYSHLKELYRLIIQHPKVGPKEIANLNIHTIREELNLHEVDGAEETIEYEEPEPFESFGGSRGSQFDGPGTRNPNAGNNNGQNQEEE